MKIACLLGPKFEDSEFKKPYEEFKKAGHTVTIIGLEAGKLIPGDKGKVEATTDKSINEVRADQFDALLIPGGGSPDKLRANEKMVEFVRQMYDARKPIFAICHGPQLLLSADRYKGYKLTAWQTIQGDLQKAGAEVLDKEVIVDGHVVTSRKPDDIPAFIERSLSLMQKLAHTR
jgi:protease I